MKKELLSKAPWRVDDEDEETDKFSDAKLKITRDAEDMATMHVPRKKKHEEEDTEEDMIAIDPELRYSFQRNSQFLQRVFSIETVVKPLPPTIGYGIARNVYFFNRIFTQFFDPDGIANAQKSLGLGQENKTREVR